MNRENRASRSRKLHISEGSYPSTRIVANGEMALDEQRPPAAHGVAGVRYKYLSGNGAHVVLLAYGQ